MRDLDKNPYSPDEERVAKWIFDRPGGVGAGDDPIGFLITSYEYLIEERARLRAILRKVEDLRDTMSRIVADYKEQFGGPVN